jgi:4-hydroxy-3-methylbut-2-enyl diphosphate reductase
MKVIVAKSAGFCWGVKRAVEQARKLAQQEQHAIYTDGSLIHNRQMMDQLRGENIMELRDPSLARDKVILIRAHGIPPDRYKMLESVTSRLVDMTCPDVASIQRLVAQRAREGFHIVVFGDPGHAEVEGLLGHAMGRGFVVSGPDDISRLPDSASLCVVSQSTQLPESYKKVADEIRCRFPSALVLDTICKSTKNRQNDLVGLAKIVEAIVVVGDPHSANTMRLVDLAKTLRPTFHIAVKEDLDEGELRRFNVVGLTAGASTPSFVLDAVRTALLELHGVEPA